MFEEIYNWIKDGMPERDFPEDQKQVAKLIKIAVTQPQDVVSDATQKIEQFCMENKLLGKPQDVKLKIEDLQEFLKESLEILKRKD